PDSAQKKEGESYTLYQALEKVEKGDKIVLAPGIYNTNFKIKLVGTPEQPIQIVGQGEATKIEGVSTDNQFCMAFKDSHFVEFHNLSFSNCGPVQVALKDSTYFTFKDIHFVGGQA